MPTSYKYLTQSQLRRFFAEINSRRDRALFLAIYHYGLRVSEATLLKIDDVDFNRKLLFIHRLKGGRSGIKPLLSNTVEILFAYLPVRQPTGDALFTGRQGNLGRHRIGQLFKRYAHQAGLFGYSVHGLRHSIATHMLEAGFDIADVQSHLGHRKVQSTLIYAQITDKRLAKVFTQLEKSQAIVKVSHTERRINRCPES